MKIITNSLVLLTLICYLIVTIESIPISQQNVPEIPKHSDRKSRQRSRTQPHRSVVGYWDQTSDELDTQPQRWKSGAVTYGVYQRYEQMLEQNRKLFELSRQQAKL